MSAPHQTTLAGAAISLHIGQRVRHRDYNGQRVTGVVCGLSIDSDGKLEADVALDQPIVIPASAGYRETQIHRQQLPAIELSPFDDRDELMAELAAALQEAVDAVRVFHGPVGWETYRDHSPEMQRWRAAIAKATGAAPC